MTSAIDPEAQAFLVFLEQEAPSDPQRLQPFGGHIVQRAADLVDGVEIDLHAPLEED
ncbi:prlF antitoxin for toxin YhaV_toxin [Palleronia salina]|uniref:PrlF antitoxin for toxin YhaV_toxin n=1 Tax=Palleronia salina TaxID=313368 RepID=A0A1M6GS35_9RHOB|nr:type II toxin-antitoxin system PrlF family antitoxin [Palleronia salina]SHJ12727.1 prlF antitoxin for toxin YhaV_toxin [Palleronia salina]